MKQIFIQTEYMLFILIQYMRCLFNPALGKANHHCLLGLFFGYGLMFVISTLPPIQMFKNEIINGLVGDHFAITCFLYSFHTSLYFVSMGSAIYLTTIYSKPFLNFLLNNAFEYNKSAIILKLLINNRPDTFELNISHINRIRSLDILNQFDIFVHVEKNRLTPLNKLSLSNKMLIEYKDDRKFALEKINKFLDIDKSTVTNTDLNEYFKTAMLHNGLPRNFYTLYNQWVSLKLDFTESFFLKIDDIMCFEPMIQHLVQEFDENYPEDFINLSLVLSGDICRLKGYKGSCIYTTNSLFNECIKKQLMHPLNSNKKLTYGDIEQYKISELVSYLPALVYGFKIFHLQQLISLDVDPAVYMKLIDTLSIQDKEQRTCKKLMAALEEKNVIKAHI